MHFLKSSIPNMNPVEDLKRQITTIHKAMRDNVCDRLDIKRVWPGSSQECKSKLIELEEAAHKMQREQDELIGKYLHLTIFQYIPPNRTM
jgi:hypothetical protein